MQLRWMWRMILIQQILIPAWRLSLPIGNGFPRMPIDEIIQGSVLEAYNDILHGKGRTLLAAVADEADQRCLMQLRDECHKR